MVTGAQYSDGLVDDFITLVAGNDCKGRVDVQDDAMGVGHGHGLGGVLVDDFCASGRGFGLASFRDVDNNPDDGWPPVQLQPGREDFYLDRAAIGMASRDVTPHTA